MPTEPVALFPRRPPPAVPAVMRDDQPPAARDALGTALLDARRLELLILNQHESFAISSRPQFFVWTQGLLQALIPHRVLLCVLPAGEPQSFRADACTAAIASPGGLPALLLRDTAALPALLRTWKQRHYRPFACDAGEAVGPNGGGFARELARAGAGQLLVHGCHDADGAVCGLYLFACAPEAAAAELLYPLQMCLPFVHAAWVRAQMVPRDAAAAPAPSGAALTAREREILRWIYLGKSNAEIGVILRISPMTVKNHVQKILRKLDVVNRAQAVGKALDAQIIGH